MQKRSLAAKKGGGGKEAWKKTRSSKTREERRKSLTDGSPVSIILLWDLLPSVQMVRLYQKNRQYKAQE